MIIALEGAPATGKSTVGAYLADHHDAICIEEVNKLFSRPKEEPFDWYFDRQLERLAMAKMEAEDGKMVVLAGDPYQPIWFNWLFPEMGFAPWTYVLEFFESRITQSHLPDFYGFMTASNEELLRRQINREAERGNGRARGEVKYARYAPLAIALDKFFTAMGNEFSGFAQHVVPGDIGDMASAIVAHEYETPESHDFFNFVRSWLARHDPSGFR